MNGVSGGLWPRNHCSSSSALTSAGRLSAFTKTCQKMSRTRTRVGAAANLRPAEEGKMRFRRRASKCSYLLGKGSPQTAPTFAVVPHHLTSSVFPMPPAQLQPLWIKRCARRKSQRPLGEISASTRCTDSQRTWNLYSLGGSTLGCRVYPKFCFDSQLGGLFELGSSVGGWGKQTKQTHAF